LRKNKSAIKRARQSEEKRLRNSHVKSTMKTHIKKVVVAMENKAIEKIDSFFKSAISYINKASSKGVIHKNNASRKISRLTKKFNSFSQPKG
jgi:small subunit ribosomal protein S20